MKVENILKKANQKRLLSNVTIEGGNFTTAFFKENTIKDLFNAPSGLKEYAAEQEAMEIAVKEGRKSPQENAAALTKEQMELVRKYGYARYRSCLTNTAQMFDKRTVH